MRDGLEARSRASSPKWQALARLGPHRQRPNQQPNRDTHSGRATVARSALTPQTPEHPNAAPVLPETDLSAHADLEGRPQGNPQRRNSSAYAASQQGARSVSDGNRLSDHPKLDEVLIGSVDVLGSIEREAVTFVERRRPVVTAQYPELRRALAHYGVM